MVSSLPVFAVPEASMVFVSQLASVALSRTVLTAFVFPSALMASVFLSVFVVCYCQSPFLMASASPFEKFLFHLLF